jgi:hypothetical protein
LGLGRLRGLGFVTRACDWPVIQQTTLEFQHSRDGEALQLLGAVSAGVAKFTSSISPEFRQ